MTLKAAAEEQDGHGLEADDIIGSIDNMGGDDRFRFGLKSWAGFLASAFTTGGACFTLMRT